MHIINIEGLDGVGKATNTALVKEYFTNMGYRVHTQSFPRYETNIGSAISDLLKGNIGGMGDLPSGLVSPFYTTDRVDWFRNEFTNLRDKYDIVILDRCFYSNFLYQGCKLYDSTNESNLDFIKWIYDQYKWEFELSDLTDKEIVSTKTYVLTISEKFRLAQINTRSSQDTAESNLDYQDKVKRFFYSMIDPNIMRGLINAINDLFKYKSIKETSKTVIPTRVGMISKYFRYVYNVELNPISISLDTDIDTIATTLIDINNAYSNYQVYDNMEDTSKLMNRDSTITDDYLMIKYRDIVGARVIREIVTDIRQAIDEKKHDELVDGILRYSKMINSLMLLHKILEDNSDLLRNAK